MFEVMVEPYLGTRRHQYDTNHVVDDDYSGSGDYAVRNPCKVQI
jgi:hypothetical protein